MSDGRNIEKVELPKSGLAIFEPYEQKSFAALFVPAKSNASDILPKFEIVHSITNISTSTLDYGQVKVDNAGRASLFIDNHECFSYGPSSGKETFAWSGDRLDAIKFSDNSSLRFDSAKGLWQKFDAAGMPVISKGRLESVTGHNSTFDDGPFHRTVTISGEVTMKKLYDQFTQFKQDTEKAKAFLTPEQRDDLFKLEKSNESSEKCAYKDTKGIETCAIGFNLRRPDARAKIEAMGLDYDEFYKSADRKYKAVKPELNDQQIKKLFDGDISQTVIETQNLYPNFHSMPGKAKVVAVDLTFNMGAAKLSEFTTFNKFMREGNFAAAGQALKRTAYAEQVKGRAVRNVDALLQSSQP